MCRRLFNAWLVLVVVCYVTIGCSTNDRKTSPSIEDAPPTTAPSSQAEPPSSMTPPEPTPPPAVMPTDRPPAHASRPPTAVMPTDRPPAHASRPPTAVMPTVRPPAHASRPPTAAMPTDRPRAESLRPTSTVMPTVSPPPPVQATPPPVLVNPSVAVPTASRPPQSGRPTEPSTAEGSRQNPDNSEAVSASEPMMMEPPVPTPTTQVDAGSSGPTASPQGGINPSSPTIVDVYYGTNRAHLEASFFGYLKPFTAAAILLALLFLVPAGLRYLLKDHLHRVAINLVRVVFVVALVYFVPVGLQKSIQRWQANQSLPVQYGPERYQSTAGGKSYEVGITKVSIPAIHVTGQLELPDVMHFEFGFDPAKHFVLNDIKPLSDRVFMSKLQQRVAASSKRDMFVFVHGFHNTFQDAAFRTAQIAHDMKFEGAPVFFSWPSQGKVLDYTTDENNVGEAVQYLVDFLDFLRTESGAERIHIIAHSMGSRALTAAVKEIGLRNSGQRVFNEMILAAPDIDAALFRNMAPDLTAATDRVTLYASSKDQALVASREVHGGTYARAGESLPTPVTVSPVESIDVSNVTGGHSYISDSGRILDDVNNILLYSRGLNRNIADRFLDAEDKVYWVLKQSVESQ